MYWLIPALDGTAALFLGLFVFSRNRRKAINTVFLVMMLGVCAFEGMTAAFLRSGEGAGEAWFYPLLTSSLVAALLAANLFSMFFGHRDPRPVLRSRAPLLAVQLGAGAAILGWTWLSHSVLSAGPGNLAPGFSLGAGSRPALAFTAFSLVTVIYHMETLFRRASGIRRWQFKYAVIGVAAASVFFLLETGLVFASLALPGDLLLANSLVLLVSQAIFLYAIVRHRLLDVDVFVSRQVTYTAFLSFAALIYFLAVGLFAVLNRMYGGRYGLFIAGTGLFFLAVAGIVLLLSEHVRFGIRHFIDTHFYKNKYEYRLRWNSFTRNLGNADDLPGLCRTILVECLEAMWVRQGSLWLAQEVTGPFTCQAAEEGAPLPGTPVRRGSALVKALSDAGDPLTADTLRQLPGVAHEMDSNFGGLTVRICAPLMFRRRLIGFLTLGPNLFGEPFGYEDQEMLMTLCRQSASALYRHLLAEELATARGLESLDRLSSFIIHDLKNAVSMLSMVVQNASSNFHKPEFQRDAAAAIKGSVDKIQRLVETLSVPKAGDMESRHRSVELNRIIDTVVEKLELAGLPGVTIVRAYSPVPPLLAVPDMLDRLFENLLLNAVQALPPEGGEIGLRTGVTPAGEALAEVTDSGCGMAPGIIDKSLFKPFHTTKEKGVGIGLYHCRSIVTAHGGRIEVRSSPGKGSTFRILLPRERVGAKEREGEREAPRIDATDEVKS